MDKEQILTKIQDCGIVAVVRAESADQASRIADACIEGGVAAIELTFTVPPQNAPSLSQAQRLKKLAQEGHFSYDVAFAVMGEEKKDELDKVVIKNDTLRKYFPRSYTPKQMEDTIIKLLEQWQRKQQRQNER